jgi:hypothetical protein
MLARVGGSTVLVLLVAGGVAVAATRSAAADPNGVSVCVNKTNGLVRVADTCRDHETTMALGGSDLQVTRGEVTLAVGAQAVTGTLPVTGLRLTGECVPAPPQIGDALLARMRVTAVNGQAFDAFVDGGFTPSLSLGVTETLLPPAAGANGAFQPETSTLQTVLIKTPAGTATIKIGGFASVLTHTCRFFWQAEEVPA